MSSPKIPQPSRRCLFCGGSNVSGEHLWSDWMGPLLPDSSTSEIQRGHGDQGLRVVRRRQGGIKKAKMLAPCQSCNSGWMSELEKATQPILAPLIVGHPAVFGEEAQLHLARWLTLKAFVVDYNYPPDTVVPQSDRDKFFACRTIPLGLKIWLAKCGAGRWESKLYRQSVLAAKGTLPPEGTQKNIHVMTLGIGQLLAHVTIVKADGLDLDNYVPLNQAFFRLWPYSGEEFFWPFCATLDQEGAERLARRLDDFMARPATRLSGELKQWKKHRRRD